LQDVFGSCSVGSVGFETSLSRSRDPQSAPRMRLIRCRSPAGIPGACTSPKMFFPLALSAVWHSADIQHLQGPELLSSRQTLVQTKPAIEDIALTPADLLRRINILFCTFCCFLPMLAISGRTHTEKSVRNLLPVRTASAWVHDLHGANFTASPKDSDRHSAKFPEVNKKGRTPPYFSSGVSWFAGQIRAATFGHDASRINYCNAFSTT